VRYFSTKTYGHELGLSCCFRQHKAKSHCNRLHGYAISVKLVFEADTLDHRNWVQDFGDLDWVKTYLKQTFDHTTVVAADDPAMKVFEDMHSKGLLKLVVREAVGCEAFAMQIADYVASGLPPRVNLLEVEVREHGANSAGVKIYGA